MTATHPPAMTDAEREQHIADLAGHMEAAYARFEAHHDPADRDNAVHFMHLRDEAIKSRSADQQARITARIEEAIDNGVDYFQVMGARHAAELRQEASANA